jgi:hypothetical protein
MPWMRKLVEHRRIEVRGTAPTRPTGEDNATQAGLSHDARLTGEFQTESARFISPSLSNFLEGWSTDLQTMFVLAVKR